MPARTNGLTPEQGRERAAAKIEVLRQRIKAGVDALDRGDFVEVDEADLEDFLKSPCSRRRPACRPRS
jgi:hypothetical protein